MTGEPKDSGRRLLIFATLLLLAGCRGSSPQADVGATEGLAPEHDSGSRYATIGDIERLDPALDSLIAPTAEIEILAEGFDWAEGPIWVEAGDFVLFSDVPTNRVYRWKEGEGHRVWLEPSGYTGEVQRGGEPGSNGLTLDAAGQLVLSQHGDRRIARLEAPMTVPEPAFSTIADRFEGKRFNSPNDVVQHSSGAFYFTDPPYGLAEGPEDPNRDMDFAGVFRVATDGAVSLLTSELSRPNGIALSPDERTLYVANSDPEKAIWMAYEVQPDGLVDNGRVFFDATPWVPDRQGLPDGLKADRNGNLFATGPGGVLVFSPEGAHLGTIRTTQATANCAIGDDGRTLYITADMYLLRIELQPSRP